MTINHLRYISLLSFILVVGCTVKKSTVPSTEKGMSGDEKMVLTLSSSDLEENGLIPSTYTCAGEDISPPLSWTNVPAGAQSLALIMDDPDAPLKTWVHWVLFNLPASTTSLPAGIEKSPTIQAGGVQGMNDFRKPGYGGPCPPPGKPHRYVFKLYALDTLLNLKPGTSTKADLEKAMQGHILARGELVGLFSR